MTSPIRFMVKSIAATVIVCSSFNTLAIQDNSYLNDPEHQFWFSADNAVPTVKLTFTEDQWDELLGSTQNYRPEVHGNLLLNKDDQEYIVNDIGIKIGGNTSFTLPEYNNDEYVQANFTLDFDEFVDDQELSGIAALKLKRFKGDSTFVHEPLSNQIMQNFDIFTVHSSTYARVEIKVGDRRTAYYGMYRMNESVNRGEYIDKRFGKDNDKGYLWQGNNKDWGKAHFSKITPTWGGVGEFDQASFEFKSKGKYFEAGHALLVDMAQNFTNLEGQAFVDYVDQHVSIPLLLKGLASEAVLGHWDGFWGNGNNYLIYIDESEIMYFIPYDTDNTLGTSSIIADAGERDPLKFGSSSNAPKFVTKILAVEKYMTEYKMYLQQLVTQANLQSEEYAVSWIEAVHQKIGGMLNNDTGDNERIADRPASWGNQSGYRIFETNTGKNWYETRRNAVLNALKDPEQVYASVYYRGVTNGWNTSLMDQESINTWSISVDNNADTNSSGIERFKFDIFADWSQNYGDDNADGVVESSGDDILFTEGYGTYKITFNAETLSYSVVKQAVGPQAPIADAGEDFSAVIGFHAGFSAANSTDADGDIVSYVWSNNLEGKTASKIYDEAGVYTVTLIVTDNDGLSSTDTVVVTVTDGTQPLQSNFEQVYLRGTTNGWGTSAMTLVEDNVWQIEATFDTANNTYFKFDILGDWTQNYGDNNQDGIANNLNGDSISITEGTFIITFNDETFAYTTTLTNSNEAPIANAGADITILVGETITLDASASSDEDGSIEFYRWDNAVTNTSFTETFLTAGEFTFTVTVTDNEGAIASDTVTVIVKEPITTVDVTFTCKNGITTNGKSVYVVGNIAELGNWSIDTSAQQLHPTSYPTWSATIAIPANTEVKWKCVKAAEKNLSIYQWENGSNTKFNSASTTSTSGSF